MCVSTIRAVPNLINISYNTIQFCHYPPFCSLKRLHGFIIHAMPKRGISPPRTSQNPGLRLVFIVSLYEIPQQLKNHHKHIE